MLSTRLNAFILFLALLSGAVSAQVRDFLPEEVVKVANDYYSNQSKEFLLQGLRKAGLAYYATELIKVLKDNPLAPWIESSTNQTQQYYNQYFEDQLAFALLLLKTGDSLESGNQYSNDVSDAAEYFVNEAPATGLFPDQKNIDDIEFALQTIGDSSKCFRTDARGVSTHTLRNGCSFERLNLYKFFQGIRHIDLRRITDLTKKEVLAKIADYLGFATPNDPSLQKLWDYEGALLLATGDSDMDRPGSRTGTYDDSFFSLANNHALARAKIAELHNRFMGDLNPQKVSTSASSSSAEPPIIEAKADKNDPYFAYALRPTIAEAISKKLYPQEVIDRIPDHKKYLPLTSVPWTFVNLGEDALQREKLSKIVPDRWTDPATGKRYVLMYHGTTSDLLGVFKEGEKAVRFDVATNKALGMGFYLTANFNEAKMYSCWRLQQRRAKEPDLKAMVIVFGIEENDLIKGRISKAHLSDDKTGEPLDIQDYFKRNSARLNQFNFFKNVHDYLKAVRIVLLPQNFEMAELRVNNDYDGQTSRDVLEKDIARYTCPY